MKWIIFQLALVISLVVTFGASSAMAYFGRNLTIGSTGEDVRALQVLLNQSADTRLAALGVGSPGSETDYFGPITAMAVKRFQEKYAAAVLLPAGLSVGTGFVGPATRMQLNSLDDISALGKIIEAVLVTSEVGPQESGLGDPTSGVVASKPVITAISPIAGSAGTKVTITGRGFLSSGNTVYTGYDQVTAGSSNGTTVTFTFDPPFASEASGKASYLEFDSVPMRFYISNSNGLSGPSPEFNLTF